MKTITGRFDVQMTPQGEASPDTGATTYRLDKRYHGPLDATAVGTMLGHVTVTKGSAGYVAIERVTGTLDGRKGSLVLQHSGLMDRGAKQLEIRVVPDSADGELVGLRGRMEIRSRSVGRITSSSSTRRATCDLPRRRPGGATWTGMRERRLRRGERPPPAVRTRSNPGPVCSIHLARSSDPVPLDPPGDASI